MHNKVNGDREQKCLHQICKRSFKRGEPGKFFFCESVCRCAVVVDFVCDGDCGFGIKWKFDVRIEIYSFDSICQSEYLYCKRNKIILNYKTFLALGFRVLIILRNKCSHRGEH